MKMACQALTAGGAHVYQLARLLTVILFTVAITACTHPYTTSVQDGTATTPGPSNSSVVVTPVPYGTSPWNFLDSEGVRLTSEHYHIYTTLEDPKVRQRLPAFMEGALLNYRTTFGQLPDAPGKLDIYIMQDRRQWKNLSRQLLPEHAPLLEMVTRGGFTSKGIALLFFIDWASQSNNTMTIAAHEGWHQYIQTTFASPLPVWLDEGLATYFEGHRVTQGVRQFDASYNSSRRQTLQRAIQSGQVIPLRQLMNEPPNTFLETGRKGVLLYYAQVWALAHYLADNPAYRRGLEAILIDAQRGTLPQKLKRRIASMIGTAPQASSTSLGRAVITEYFDPSFDRFEAGYWRFARQLGTRQSPH